ncbi:MAG: hypothetical protein H0X51_06520 [Parachlamydiaceae bacterium]|nr:hypothetical protein [Parachlamydiaceae bacterium]
MLLYASFEFCNCLFRATQKRERALRWKKDELIPSIKSDYVQNEKRLADLKRVEKDLLDLSKESAEVAKLSDAIQAVYDQLKAASDLVEKDPAVAALRKELGALKEYDALVLASQHAMATRQESRLQNAHLEKATVMMRVSNLKYELERLQRENPEQAKKDLEDILKQEQQSIADETSRLQEARESLLYSKKEETKLKDALSALPKGLENRLFKLSEDFNKKVEVLKGSLFDALKG